MKYIILIGDGMGDYPNPELGGRTLLEAAKTPNMDRLAREGLLGLTRTIPADKDPSSDVANMSIMGYDPARYHTGRSPIEAAAMGVELKPDEVAFRCNFVTLDHRLDRVVMADYAAAHIKSEEAAPLIRVLDAALGGEGLRFMPGVSYRHLLVWKNGPLKAATVPPHDRIGQAVDDVLSDAGELGRVTALTCASWLVLMAHPHNQERAARGLGLVNSIWLWGQGTRPSYPTFKERYGLTGVAISAVDLVKGLGRLAGLDPVEVPGATGYLDTNYAGKVAAALKGLETGGFAFVHVEAPDEAGHVGKLAPKMQAIQDFDEKVVGPLLVGLQAFGQHRVLLAADHYTPLSLRTHTREPVPFVLWDSEVRGTGGEGYNEPAAARTGLLVPQAHTLLERLVEAR